MGTGSLGVMSRLAVPTLKLDAGESAWPTMATANKTAARGARQRENFIGQDLCKRGETPSLFLQNEFRNHRNSRGHRGNEAELFSAPKSTFLRRRPPFWEFTPSVNWIHEPDPIHVAVRANGARNSVRREVGKRRTLE